MQKVSDANKADLLNAIETLKDYRRKLSVAGVSATISQEQDENGATLVLHVHGRGVEEADCLGTLAKRLKAVGDSVTKEIAVTTQKAKAKNVQGEATT